MKLSGVIIARNEENIIADAIDSLKFCDEVVVIDNKSIDRTKELAEKLGAKVYSASEEDFSKLREIGKEKAEGEWIFYLDSDERASSDLGKEILKKIDAADVVAYRVPRKNFYLGKNEWPVMEKLERVFLKSQLKGWKGKLHETALYDGKLGELVNYITHFTHRDLTSMLDKTIEWSDIEAKNRIDANHPRMSWWRFPRVMITSFLNSYVKQKGYKAGTAGLIESLYQSFSTFVTYAKLWEMQNKPT
jgi:glycosyltransferase involved in cell wall biosynthesis